MSDVQYTTAIPKLAEGEVYVGVLGNANGELHHVILLPGDNDDAPWQDQMEWAKSIGGDLPNRIEQAMLWENHRDQFQKDWYWSDTLDHDDPSAFAWYQNFDDGYQTCTSRDNDLRARAVRRLTIQSFGNLGDTDSAKSEVAA